jgi:hypothetical protein
MCLGEERSHVPRKTVYRSGIPRCTGSIRIRFPRPIFLPEDEGRCVLGNVVMFRVLRFVRLKKTTEELSPKQRKQ